MKVEIIDGELRVSINRGDTMKVGRSKGVYDGASTSVTRRLTDDEMQRVTKLLKAEEYLAQQLALRAVSKLKTEIDQRQKK